MNIEKLKNRDYVLVIDRSGSMSANDMPNGQTRWQAMQETTLAVARKLTEFDPDGITVIAFNGGIKRYDNVTDKKVEEIFKEMEPLGGTLLKPVFENVFTDYLNRKSAGKTKASGEIMVIVTDGAASDEDEALKSIVAFGNKLDNADDEYGISFFQIGRDPSASAFLKRLDDELVSKYGAKHDIVDAKTFDEIESIGLTEAIIQSLTD